MKKIIGVFIICIVVITNSCSSDSQQTESSATSKNEIAISQDELGDRWPFTVPKGVIRCEQGNLIVFVADGIRYAINGSARGAVERMGYKDLEEIWKDNPEYEGFKISVDVIIAKGKELCQ